MNARLDYEARAKNIKDELLPLIKEAIASGDSDRLILLESQREFRLLQAFQKWRAIDESIVREYW